MNTHTRTSRFTHLSWFSVILCVVLLFGLMPVAVAAQPSGATSAGVYKAWSSSPEGRPIESTLYLNIDGTALMINDPLFGEPPVTRTGQWSSAEDGVLLTLTDDAAGSLPEPRSVLLDTSIAELLIMRSDEAIQELAGRRYYSIGFLLENRNTLPFRAEVAASAIASRGLAGAYKAFAPGGGSGRIDLTLMLFPDFRVILTRDSVDGSAPSLTYGAWQDVGGQAFVILTETDSVPFRTPVEITFGVENGILRGLTTASANAADLVGIPFHRIEGLANAVTVLLPPDVNAPSDAAGSVSEPGLSMSEGTPPSDEAATFPETMSGLPPISTEIIVEYEPSFAEVACPIDLLADPAITCGFLTVPENRSRRDSQSIRLFVVKLAAQVDPPAPDPLLVLAGVLGDDPSMLVQWFAGAPVRQRRDVLILHSRGSGLSEPSLACPEYVGGEDSQAMLQSLSDCYNRLLQDGYDLAGYNLDQQAFDVIDLVRALGLAQINLLGSDMGAAVSQLVLERSPAMVRSIVLESPVPVGVNRTLESAFGAFDALRELFADCERSTACAAAYPDLEARFLQLIDWYNENPTPESIGFGDGNAIAALIFGRLQSGSDDIPALIQALYTGDFGTACQIAPVVGGCMLPMNSAPSPNAPTPTPPEETSIDLPNAESTQSWRTYFVDPENPVGADAATLDRLQRELEIETRSELLEFLDALPHQNFLPLLAAITGPPVSVSPSIRGTEHGGRLNILCGEDATRYTIGDLQHVAKRLPSQVAPLLTASAEELLLICALWLTPSAASGDRIVQIGSAPALIMADKYDPVTPARWARRSAADFRQPFVRVFVGEGRNLLRAADSCAQQMLAAFVEHPNRAPDAYCFRSQRPTFLLPAPSPTTNTPPELVGRSQSE